MLKQYEDALTFMKMHGALLNHVRAEHLLSMAQFARVLALQRDPNIKRSPADARKQKQWLDKHFSHLSRDSWLTLMYQAIKTFVLSRVTLKSFKAVPGLPPTQLNAAAALMDGNVTASNVFSLPENILLKWLQLHYNQVHPPLHWFVLIWHIDVTCGQ